MSLNLKRILEWACTLGVIAGYILVAALLLIPLLMSVICTGGERP